MRLQSFELETCSLRRGATALTVTAFAVLLAGCSAQQLYTTSQSWQRNECQRLPDTQDRTRCLAANSATFDEYKRQADSGSVQNR